MNNNIPTSSSSSTTAIPLSSVLLCNPNQVKNPVYNAIRNTPKQVSNEIKADFATSSACVLYLSLKFHNQHPKYVEMRIREIGRNYKVRILLVLVDTEDNVQLLLTINKVCFNTNFTLILAWSIEECARYLETLKIYESKSSSSIQEKVETEFLPKLTKVLTSVRSINKTDVATLLDTFGTLSNIINADEQHLMLCPGLGEKKVKRLFQAFHEPFIKKKSAVNNDMNPYETNTKVDAIAPSTTDTTTTSTTDTATTTMTTTTTTTGSSLTPAAIPVVWR